MARSPFRDPAVAVPAALALLVVLVAAAAPLLAPYDPAAAACRTGSSTRVPPDTCSAPTARAVTC
ncbi:hypothetical protein ACFQ1I_34265 [Kitasatospora arboriphila]